MTSQLESSKIDGLVGVGPRSEMLESSKVDGVAAIGPRHGMIEVTKIDSFTSLVMSPSLAGERITVDEWIGPMGGNPG